jgi:aspartate/methionine/tyrosine aminotransferase
MLVVCDPLNPFGVVQTESELLALAQLCESRGVLILNNITHGTHRTNPEARHTPMAVLSSKTSLNHVVSVTGLSKGYGMAALRLGFMGGHPTLLRAAARVRMEVSGIHINPLAQRAALAALPDQLYVAACTQVLRRNLKHLRDTLAQIGEVRLAIEPDYGFCACLDVSGSGVSAQELTVALFRQGICVIAGDALGCVGATRYVRLNYSSPHLHNMERLREALPRAIRDAQSGRYLEGVRNFYRSRSSSRARRVLARLEAERRSLRTKFSAGSKIQVHA